MFTVIMPAWEGEACWTCLVRSRFARRHIHLLPAEHGFLEGAQHNRPSRYRAASAATSVIVLQNDAAARKWPVHAKHERALRRAFAPKRSRDVDVHAGHGSTGKRVWGSGGDVMQGGDFAVSTAAQPTKRKREPCDGPRDLATAAVPGSGSDVPVNGVQRRRRSQSGAALAVSPDAAADAVHVPALPASAQMRFNAESTVPVPQLALAKSGQQSGKPARKRSKHRGAASTGKFASTEASAHVLDAVLASTAERDADCEQVQKRSHRSAAHDKDTHIDANDQGEGGSLQSADDGSAGVVSFAGSKSQRRAYRHNRHKHKRKMQQQQALRAQA